ncbi:MAG: tetratricopeptide repeat protein [Rhizobiaceae bacterium]
MSICKPIVLAVLSAAVLAAAPANAFDASKQFDANEEPRNILKYGYQALKRGAFDEAIGAFRFGASKNDVASQWKLAHMLQTGTGERQDHKAAYELYTKIADRFAEKAPAGHNLAYVSSAVVMLGRYDLMGIDGFVAADPRRAEFRFYRAAALYHDGEAQYQLGKLYRSGKIGAQRPRSAARWFSLSARKRHPLAQAELGQMLFAGEGVIANPVRGLVMMARAAEALPPGKDIWVHEAYAKALDSATAAHRKEVEATIARIKQRSANRRSFALERMPGPQAASRAVSID